MPNINLKCQKPKSCDTCRFNQINLMKFPTSGWCILLNEQLILTKIKKRKKNCPFYTKKNKFLKIIKEIKKCLKLKKKPK